MLKLFQRPWGEHDPRENGVEKKYDGVGYSSSHAVSS